MSGTDGNNHGLYFGVNYLKKKTSKMSIHYFLYQSDFLTVKIFFVTKVT